MNNEGYCSDSTVAGPMDRRRQKRRNEVCQSFTCTSPWFIVRRWITGSGKSSGAGHRSSVRRTWGKERKAQRNLDVDRNFGILNGLGDDEPPSSSPDVSEIGREASFNLGVGFGLIYLVAASRNELNKMVELHKEIEMLLQNLHRQLQNQNKFEPLSMPIKPTTPSSFSNTLIPAQTLSTEENYSGVYSSSQDVQRAEIGIISDHYRCGKNFSTDQIKVEVLEAEFDGLQVQPTVEETTPEWSTHLWFDKHAEHREDQRNNEYYSVPPRELERKLHELLEVRQQERINELETSLDRAMQQLGEKERELSWWKDTARLIARHLPPVPNLVRQVKLQHINGGHEQEINVREMSRSMVMNSLFETMSENVGGEC